MIPRVLALAAVTALVAALLVAATAGASGRRCRGNPFGCGPNPVIKHVPKECSERTFVAVVRIKGLAPVGRVRIKLDRTTIAVRRDRKHSVPVDCSRLNAGKHRFTVLATDRLGRPAATEERFEVLR